MPSDFTYADLVTSRGEMLAWHILAEIEKAAGIKPQMWSSDPEARLAYALWLQDNPPQERLAA